ncbi:uncharacterized protein P884DRAFT_264312 [Thermothelomyces heterothallicus CBS 202.75]|uniref:uncharacterized protein n=1 Tax=Thermothelomyces heterothallicus CBS 202.75 TaxID=1149848 RepID=UPI003744867B
MLASLTSPTTMTIRLTLLMTNSTLAYTLFASPERRGLCLPPSNRPRRPRTPNPARSNRLRTPLLRLTRLELRQHGLR